jgi:hypothetical protein
MDDPLGLSKPYNAETVRTIKGWVKDLWELPETAVVMASELQCYETDCPPLETVITVQFEDRTKIERRLHKPMMEIDRTDIVLCSENLKAGCTDKP